MRKVLIIITLLTLVGCATTQGQDVSLDVYQSFVVGETTKSDIVAKLGEPSGLSFGAYPNGAVEMINYRSSRSDSSPGAFIPLIGSLFMTASTELKTVSFGFDKSGILTYQDYQQNRSDYEGGLLNGEIR